MILLILTLTINAMQHYRQIEQDNFIDYQRENLISASLIVLVGIVGFLTGRSVRATLSVYILAPSVRWIVHDLTLNYLRGLPWDYLGTRSQLDIMLRRWQQSTNVHFIFLKVVALIVSMTIAFLIAELCHI